MSRRGRPSWLSPAPRGLPLTAVMTSPAMRRAAVAEGGLVRGCAGEDAHDLVTGGDGFGFDAEVADGFAGARRWTCRR